VQKRIFLYTEKMLFVSLTEPEIPAHLPDGVDGLELRLDHWRSVTPSVVKGLLASSPRPVLLTLRKISQGGKFPGSEEEREQLILKLLELHPPYFDLEGDMRPEFLRAALQNHPRTRFILSHHDFDKTPLDLDAIYRPLARYSPFCCKIAAHARSANDALRMLLFVRRHPHLAMICMGERGAFGRILGKVAGNAIDYAILKGHASTADGQLFAEDLIEIYRYPLLNRTTAVYGLIGNPIEASPGHLYHNDVFQKRHLNAIYVKMVVDPPELPDFMKQIQAFGFKGLSVTIPLKEKIVPFVDGMDEKTRQIGAVNTLRFAGGRVIATNTDGAGALDALEAHGKVRGKKVVLLGAGGAARAIAFEARSRGAHLLILNRTLSRAQELAAAIHADAGGLSDIPPDADILINCSPNPMPIDMHAIPPRALVMDISLQETPFLVAAKNKGCLIIPGEAMYRNQAAAQTHFWLD
jgi:3-dehydroquinate dehydratase/shikimate dehydrogenase